MCWAKQILGFFTDVLHFYVQFFLYLFHTFKVLCDYLEGWRQFIGVIGGKTGRGIQEERNSIKREYRELLLIWLLFDFQVAIYSIALKLWMWIVDRAQPFIFVHLLPLLLLLLCWCYHCCHSKTLGSQFVVLVVVAVIMIDFCCGNTTPPASNWRSK